MAPVWFKPRRYGYGATPITWQGWALVAAFVAIVVLLWWQLIGFEDPVERSNPNNLYFYLCVIVIAAVFWQIAKRTTRGEWRWRWGEDSE